MAKEEKSQGPVDVRAMQEEVAYLRQMCNSLVIRGHYAECVKTIEDNLPLFYTGERWPENFFTILKLYQKCYPSLDKSQDLADYLAPILKKNSVPFVFASLLKAGGEIDWKAESFKDRAVLCQNEGKYEEAVAYIDIVLKIDPRSASAHVMRGWFLAELGRDKEALEMYGAALELSPGNKHALASIAKHYGKTDPKKALEYIDNAIKDQPAEPSYYASKAEILRLSGDNEGALAAIDKAVDNDPYNPEYPYQKAELLLADGKEGAALPQYRLALALNERHIPSLLRLVELTQQGQPELALGYAGTVVAAEPENRPMMLTRAKLQQRLGQNDAAEKQYKKLLTLDPDSVESLGGLGGLYLAEGDAAGAAEVLDRAVALAPANAQYHYDKGRACRLLEQNAEAEKEFRAATSEDKTFFRAWAELGYLNAEANPKEAAELFTKAIKLSPETAAYYAARAEVRRALADKPADVIADYGLACRYDPGNGAFHYQLGKLLEATENGASAALHYKQAVSLDPRNADAFFRLARLQYDTQPELALVSINNAISLDLVSGLYLYFKGKILSSFGVTEQDVESLAAFLATPEAARSESPEELAELSAGKSLSLALLYLSRSIELEPGNVAYLSAHAFLLHRMGQTGKALEQYEKLLKQNKDQHEALFGVARILAERKDKKALDYFDHAIKTAPAVAEYHAAKAAYLAGDDSNYTAALEEYSAAIRLNKLTWRVILEKARLLDHHGDIPAALEEYRHVLMVYKKSVEAAGRLGELLSDLAPDHALIYLNQSVKLEPENHLAYAYRAKVLFLLGRDEDAANDLAVAVHLGGETAAVLLTLATLLEKVRPELSLDYAGKALALALAPANAEVHALLGALYLARGEYPPAKEHYEKAAELQKGNHELKERLAEIAFLTDDPAMNEIASEAHKSEPECLTCTYLKARILEEKEDNIPSALAFMTRVVELAPDVLAYREKLVELLEKKRAFLRLPLEKFRLDKLRKKLAEPLNLPPPPAFEEDPADA